MSSDRLTVEQVAILKAADANGKLLHDTDMRRLFKHIEALEGEAMLLRRSLGQRQEQLEAAEARAERLEGEVERMTRDYIRSERSYAEKVAADARAERLRAFVQRVATGDMSGNDILAAIARKALEDDKQ